MRRHTGGGSEEESVLCVVRVKLKTVYRINVSSQRTSPSLLPVAAGAHVFEVLATRQREDVIVRHHFQVVCELFGGVRKALGEGMSVCSRYTCHAVIFMLNPNFRLYPYPQELYRLPVRHAHPDIHRDDVVDWYIPHQLRNHGAAVLDALNQFLAVVPVHED